ncbi:MAG: YtxH domain-containing protein [Opitutaceae bacterium]|nr:YtxH domain-containing protein [Cytophagales bacterium]
MSKSSTNLFFFIAGAAAGAILGILYAPEKGTITRKNLGSTLDDYRQKLKAYIDKLSTEQGEEIFTAAKSEGQRVINDAKQEAERLLQDVEDLINQISTSKKA